MRHIVKKLHHYHSALGWSGVIAFCFAKLFRKHFIFAVRMKGIAHPVYVRLASTDVSVFKQVLIECHYSFPLDFSPGTIIDAGANIGLSAVFFANRYPKSTILAIEPERSNYELLVRNSANYPNIKPLRAALWNANGFVSLIDSGAGNHGFQTAESDVHSQNAGDLVPAVTVAHLMSKEGWSTIDLLKMDIEGSEKEVFDTSATWIGKVRAIMVELHEEIRAGCKDSFAVAVKGFEDGGSRGESVLVFKTPVQRPVSASF